MHQALISSLQFKAALISAGVDNQYGHPHPETLNATFANAHVPWASTSEQGCFGEPNPQRQQDQLFIGCRKDKQSRNCMQVRDFIKHLKNGERPPLTLILGEEQALRQQAQQALANLIPEDQKP